MTVQPRQLSPSRLACAAAILWLLSLNGAAATGPTGANRQTLQLPDGVPPSFNVAVVLDGVTHEVRLERFPEEWSFRLLVHDSRGVHETTPPEPHTYRGSVEGHPASRVAASLRDGSFDAVIVLEEAQWVVEPLGRREVTPAREHIAYRARDVLGQHLHCGTRDAAPVVDSYPRATTEGSGFAFSQGGVAQIAFDLDYEFVVVSGSVASAVADVMNIYSPMEMIFEADTDIGYDVSAIVVRATANDPYSSSDANELLGELQGEWISNQQGIERDVVHLLTGRKLNGTPIGIAMVGGVCDQSRAYGLSEGDPSRSTALRVGLMAHELGHNWNAGHCDSQEVCNIMCSQLNGCSSDVSSFAEASTEAITLYRDFTIAGLAGLEMCLQPRRVWVSPGGSSVCDGSEGCPLQTVGQALETVGAGGVVFLEPGSYPESTTASKEVDLQAPNGTAAVGE